MEQLQPWYRSDACDLATEFYVPCLTVASGYDRAAGYFTSNAFPIIAQGLSAFIRGGGRMRMVVAPVLTEADVASMRHGYEERVRCVAKAMLREWSEAELREEDASKTLAFLIAAHILDVRVAVPTQGHGLYHEKFGIFACEGKDRIAFVGSPNETAGGVLRNFEQIAVFDAQLGGREAERVAQFRKDFDGLWNNKTPGLETMELPEAVETQIIAYAPKDPPAVQIGDADVLGKLYPHQVAAIKAWNRASNRGILEMATGTGKTLTALAATSPMSFEGGVVLVAVPSVALLNQWTQEIKKRIRHAIVVRVGGGGRWKKELSDMIAEWRYKCTQQQTGGSERYYVVGVLNSLATDEAQMLLARLKGRVALVVDEVHRAGASALRRGIACPSKWRVGLSATPVRAVDDEGNEWLTQQMGPVVFRYGLPEAIRDGYLCKYSYDVAEVTLEPDERSEYRARSAELSQVYGTLCAKYPTAHGHFGRLRALAAPQEWARLSIAAAQRARVLKGARRKLMWLRRIATRPEVGACLVYCNDEQQVEGACGVLREAGRSYGVFTAGRLAGGARESILRDFAEGRIDFLVSIRCLDEGVDMPGAEHAVILASSRTEREFVQRRGRVLRLASGKGLATIHDAVVVPWDEGESASGALSKADASIMSRELERVRVFSETAENRVDALSAVARMMRALRQA